MKIYERGSPPQSISKGIVTNRLGRCFSGSAWPHRHSASVCDGAEDVVATKNVGVRSFGADLSI